MEHRRLRVAIVGAGFVSTKKHLPAWQRLKEVAEVVGIVDANEQASRTAADDFGVPRAFSSVKELLSSETVELVDICTPPSTHAELAVEAIAGGAHVLIEKPMASTVAECDEIIAAAESAGRQICVAHSDLFYPPVVRARRLVAKGKIGKFMGLRIFFSTPADYMTSQADHWAHRLRGGVIGETGPHAVYLSLAFLSRVEEVRVLATKVLEYPWSKFDDYRIQLIGPEGVASIDCVYTTDQWAAEVGIWGSRGILKLDLELMSLVEHDRPLLTKWGAARSGAKQGVGVLRDITSTATSVLSGRYKNTHDVLIEGFLQSIRDARPPPVPGSQGREAVRVMEMIADQLEKAPAG